MVFPLVMYGYESWTVKKAECRRIDAFEPWCCRRLLRVPWTASRSNQFILKEISPGCLEGMMLKLKLQYFGHLMRRVDSFKRLWCWEGLGVGEKGDDRGWDGWMASPTRWTWVWMNSGSWWRTGRPGVLQFMGLQRVRHNWATELNWKQGSQSPLYVFQQRLKKAEDWESFIGEKEEGFDYALIEDYWPGEDVGGLTRSRASYVVVGRYIFDFFWLVQSLKGEQKLGKMLTISLFTH